MKLSNNLCLSKNQSSVVGAQHSARCAELRINATICVRRRLGRGWACVGSTQWPRESAYWFFVVATAALWWGEAGEDVAPVVAWLALATLHREGQASIYEVVDAARRCNGSPWPLTAAVRTATVCVARWSRVLGRMPFRRSLPFAGARLSPECGQDVLGDAALAFGLGREDGVQAARDFAVRCGVAL